MMFDVFLLEDFTRLMTDKKAPRISLLGHILISDNDRNNVADAVSMETAQRRGCETASVGAVGTISGSS